MKKILLILFFGILTNSVFSQLTLDDEIKLKNSVGLLNDFPTSPWLNGAGFVTYLENSHLKVKYPNNFGKNKIFPGIGVEFCKCVQWVDAYIEFGGGAASNPFNEGYMYGPNTRLPGSLGNDPTGIEETWNDTQEGFEEYTFHFWQKLLNKMIEANTDFIQITKIEIIRGIEPRPNVQPIHVGKVKVWYKKCIKYDCEFFGI